MSDPNSMSRKSKPWNEIAHPDPPNLRNWLEIKTWRYRGLSWGAGAVGPIGISAATKRRRKRARAARAFD